MDLREITAIPGDHVAIYLTDGRILRGIYSGIGETLKAEWGSEEWYSGVDEYVYKINFRDEETQLHMSAKDFKVTRVEILEKGKDHDKIAANVARYNEKVNKFLSDRSKNL